MSVVVPTVDRVSLLERCLSGFETDQGASFELIVVYDGDPGVADLLASWVDRLDGLRPLKISERGASAKRNAGWRAARAEVIAFTDDDCQPAPGWLGAAVAALDAGGAGVDFVQGRVLPHPLDAEVRGAFARTVTVDGPTKDFPNANLIYRRSALERVGGYDETEFWGAGEDADMAWRVIESGGSFVFAPDALVWHAVRPAAFRQHLKSLPRWANLPLLVQRHPQIRANYYSRFFWKYQHRSALLAAAGVVGALADGRALVLTLPHLRRRVAEAGIRDGAQLAVADVAEVFVMLAGSIRYRTPLI